MELLTNIAASYTTSSSYIKSTTGGIDSDIFVIIGVVLSYALLILLIFAIYYVATALLMGSLFKKAGVKSSDAWVPFFRQYKFLQIGGQNGKIIFLSIGAIGAYLVSAIMLTISMATNNAAIMPVAILLISLAGIAYIIFYIFRVISAYNITKKLDKDPVMTLFFVISEFIWWAVVLFDKNAKFNDKNGAKRLDK